MFAMTLFSDPAYYLSVVAVVILSVTLHELAHAGAALAEGDDTPRLAGHWTLNPLVHMGKSSLILLLLVGIAWGSTPVNPARFRHPRWGDLFVSLAGPLTNGLLMLVFLAVFFVLGEPRDGLGDFLFIGAVMNAVLMLLNLIPVPPLDGFALIQALLPGIRPHAPRLAQVGFLVMILAFFVFGAGEWLFKGAALLTQLSYAALFRNG